MKHEETRELIICIMELILTILKQEKKITSVLKKKKENEK